MQAVYLLSTATYAPACLDLQVINKDIQVINKD